MSVAVSIPVVLGWKVDDRREAKTEAKVGRPKGKITNYKWPSEALVGEWKDWVLIVHNEGAEGVGGGAIGNAEGNPGSITIEFMGKYFEVKPGQRLTMYDKSWKNCEYLDLRGRVKFNAPGTYKIVLMAVHQE